MTALQAHIVAAQTTLVWALEHGQTFVPVIIVMRDGRSVAHIQPPDPGPDGDPGEVITLIAKVAADGYRADEILIVSDTYHATRLHSPITGQPWKHGEMQDVALHHDGVARGWVSDAMAIMIIRRNGPASMVSIRYTTKDKVPSFAVPEIKTDGENGFMTLGRLTSVMDGNAFRRLNLSDQEMAVLLDTVGCTVL